MSPRNFAQEVGALAVAVEAVFCSVFIASRQPSTFHSLVTLKTNVSYATESENRTCRVWWVILVAANRVGHIDGVEWIRTLHLPGSKFGRQRPLRMRCMAWPLRMWSMRSMWSTSSVSHDLLSRDADLVNWLGLHAWQSYARRTWRGDVNGFGDVGSVFVVAGHDLHRAFASGRYARRCNIPSRCGALHVRVTRFQVFLVVALWRSFVFFTKSASSWSVIAKYLLGKINKKYKHHCKQTHHGRPGDETDKVSGSAQSRTETPAAGRENSRKVAGRDREEHCVACSCTNAGISTDRAPAIAVPGRAK